MNASRKSDATSYVIGPYTASWKSSTPGFGSLTIRLRGMKSRSMKTWLGQRALNEDGKRVIQHPTFGQVQRMAQMPRDEPLRHQFHFAAQERFVERRQHA